MPNSDALLGGQLITVLGAVPARRQALITGLQQRLRAQGLAVHALPDALPDALPNALGSDAVALSSWLSAHRHTLAQALEPGCVLSPGLLILAAVRAPSATPAARALQCAAHAELQQSTLRLLCPAQRTDGTDAQALDLQLRAQLQAAGLSFSVLHGDEGTALNNAWQALCLQAPGLEASAPEGVQARAWRFQCDACSDPDCERRLFTGLRLSDAPLFP